MPDDPGDAFDAFADAIRSTEDELEAAAKLRAEREARKREADQPKKPGDAPRGDE